MNDRSSRALSSSAQRVQAALRAAGLDCVVSEHATPARTSAEAAATLGCSIGEIAKSLVFRGDDGTALLVVASGANRVDLAKLESLARTWIHKADAEFVRAVTGYAIGGVPPLGHARPLQVYVDRDLMRYELVHAAGGTPNAMFPIRPPDLVRASGGIVADIALLAQ
jgi:prolyl-tRNA editing enzyme YbaK/EbsC (Cys-tRNA(Pro) deacylase)